ncbi:VOC family protein [Nocardia halotolerans]|uniref:VOC family protein n=1 Tax=Nocardia halotolerans TaxID=1755878 RepID=A0ABV8VQT5_9NOCA
MLTVLPIRYVADVPATRRFYEGLGLVYRADGSVAVWAQLDAPAGALGIHDAAVSKGRPPGTVELGFSTDEPLEDVAARLASDGYEYTLVDEDFGRSIRVTDPDGVVIQIQEIDPDTVRRSQDLL